jgi:hypothetical protein
MLFRIKRSYRSSMTFEQIHQVLEYLLSKESGVWILKTKAYNVQVEGANFSIKKRGGSLNGPTHPSIKGEIVYSDFVRINLDIKPDYSTILFSSITGVILLLFILTDEKMNINGMYRSVTLLERIGMAIFVIAIPAIISYFKTIKPTQDAEKWLIKKMQLKPLATE